MLWKLKHRGKATWKYLSQPLFDSRAQTQWNIDSFWRAYRIQWLETCLCKDVGSESHYTQ